MSQFCSLLEKLWACDPKTPWRLDLRNVGYLGPDAAALTYAAWHRARLAGCKAEVLLPTAPPPLAAFCTFSGLNHTLAKGQRPAPDHPECETVPLAHFYQAQRTHALGVTRLVKRHLPELSRDTSFYLETSLAEVTQNIEDHAASPLGGVLCARFMSGSGQVRVAVVDHGIGIPNAIRSVRPGITDVRAVEVALKGGTTSRPNTRNQGLGLQTLSQIVYNSRGDLLILSSRVQAVQRLDEATPTVSASSFDFPGTALFFRLNVVAKPFDR